MEILRIPYRQHEHDYASGMDPKGLYFCLETCRACAAEKTSIPFEDERREMKAETLEMRVYKVCCPVCDFNYEVHTPEDLTERSVETHWNGWERCPGSDSAVALVRMEEKAYTIPGSEDPCAECGIGIHGGECGDCPYKE